MNASNFYPTDRLPRSQFATVTSTKINVQPVHNRIAALMAHTTRYAFKGDSRLALDAGVSKSAVSRLLNGQSSPSFALVSTLTKALSKRLGRILDPHEMISLDGTYPTPLVCHLCGCKGCLPSEAYDEENRIKPEWKGIQPGQWSVLPRPLGSQPAEEVQ